MTLPPRLKFGTFLAPFHALGENPTLSLHRDLELMEWLDELGFDEAWIGEHHSAGWETISSPELFIAGAAERTKHIKFGTGVHLAAVPQPADGREPDDPARPPDARPRNDGCRAGGPDHGRADDGHRPQHPAAPHGRGARHHPAPLYRDGADYLQGRMVRAKERARTPASLYLPAHANRRGSLAVACRSLGRGQVRCGIAQP